MKFSPSAVTVEHITELWAFIVILDWPASPIKVIANL